MRATEYAEVSNIPDKTYVRIHATDRKMRHRVVNCLRKYADHITDDNNDGAVTEFDIKDEIGEKILKEVTRVFNVVIVIIDIHHKKKGELVGETKHVYLRGECAFHSERKYIDDEPKIMECADKYGNTMEGFCSAWS